MRDAGLSAKAWMDVNDNAYDAVKEVMEGYAKWGNILIDNGHEDEAKSTIWPLIEYDLGNFLT